MCLPALFFSELKARFRIVLIRHDEEIAVGLAEEEHSQIRVLSHSTFEPNSMEYLSAEISPIDKDVSAR